MPYEVQKFDVSTTKKIDGKDVKLALPQATAPVFSLDEAGARDAAEYYKDKGGWGFIVGRMNTQISTDARNAIRSQYSKGPSEEQLRQDAWIKISIRSATDAEFQKKIASLAGDHDALEREILIPTIKELRDEYEQKLTASLAAAQTGAAPENGGTEEASE
jgi:hypothetical protein